MSPTASAGAACFGQLFACIISFAAGRCVKTRVAISRTVDLPRNSIRIRIRFEFDSNSANSARTYAHWQR
jgi:hypothetical protein